MMSQSCLGKVTGLQTFECLLLLLQFYMFRQLHFSCIYHAVSGCQETSTVYDIMCISLRNILLYWAFLSGNCQEDEPSLSYIFYFDNNNDRLQRVLRNKNKYFKVCGSHIKKTTQIVAQVNG